MKKFRVVKTVTQGEAIAKWKADNVRLGLAHLNEAYDRLNEEKGIVINPKSIVRRVFY